MSPRTVFMGTPEFALPSLEALAAHSDLKVVVAQPDRPRGRGRHLSSPPTATWAIERGVPLMQPARLRDPGVLDQLAAFEPELIVVAAYGKLLPRVLLDLPHLGCVNVHASLLPRYRGAAPIQWAIARGEEVTGVTLMRMEEGLDVGPILASRSCLIEPTDTGGSLTEKLAKLGGELLSATLPALYAAALPSVRQLDAEATFAPKLSREDARLDLTLNARTLHNRVRAFQPWPGARLQLREGTEVKVLTTSVVEGNGSPGEILKAARKEGLVIATGGDALRIDELQLEGGRPMPVADFLAGHRMAPGEFLPVQH